MVGKLIREGNYRIKEKFETLLKGGIIKSPIDEQIVYSQLNGNECSVWSLLLASGYLKVISYEDEDTLEYGEEAQYELMLTNNEVKRMFVSMIRRWFGEVQSYYNDFIKALIVGNLKEMNVYMNCVALNTFSYFDTGNKPSGE